MHRDRWLRLGRVTGPKRHGADKATAIVILAQDKVCLPGLRWYTYGPQGLLLGSWSLTSHIKNVSMISYREDFAQEKSAERPGKIFITVLLCSWIL